MNLSVLVRVGYCLGAVGKEVGSSMVRQSPQKSLTWGASITPLEPSGSNAAGARCLDFFFDEVPTPAVNLCRRVAMEIMHERVAGLDVHKEMVVACVRLLEGGKVSRECRRFDTTTAGLEALLAWLATSGCTQEAMEATGVYWKPVWTILSDGNFALLVANAAHIKNVPGRKTDMTTPCGSPIWWPAA